MAVRKDKCPEAVIRRLKGKKLVPQDTGGLFSFDVVRAILDDIWLDEWYVKRMLKRYPSTRRQLLTIDPAFSKVDRYIYNLFLKWKEGDPSLKISDIASLVKTYFKQECTVAHIKSIRKKAYNFRERQNKIDSNMARELVEND